MNRTEFIIRLSDDELADEISLMIEEMADHARNLRGWRNFEFFQALCREQVARAEARARGPVLDIAA
jgi:hypothetical protein